MARFNYDKISATAQKLIDRFGYDAVIRRLDSDGATVEDFSVVIVMEEYRPSERDGVLIKQTDRKCILSALGLTFTPDVDTDRLIEGGRNLQIVTVTPTAPAGTPIVYELQVRR